MSSHIYRGIRRTRGPWLISAQSPTQDWKIVKGSGGILVAKVLRWAGWRGCRKGNISLLTSFCSKLQPAHLLGQQTPAEQPKTSWLPGAPVDLLASSSQPGLDSCLLHFLPHGGWGGPPQYGLCSHWGLGKIWFEENSKGNTHPVPPQVLPYCQLAGRRDQLPVFSLSSAHSALPGLFPQTLH